MAIDTAEKRRAVAVISHYFAGPGVTPNATKDIEWRQEVGWGYPGISAAIIVVLAAFQMKISEGPSISNWAVHTMRLGR